MKHSTTFVGLDVHKRSIQAAMIAPGHACVQWQLPNEPQAVRRLTRKLLREGARVRCCYEAGPCGYALQRQLRQASIDCIVVAPSLIPTKPGERIKTDRRDAQKLAELLRADLLTEVHPPTVEDESVRDLCRCRNAAREDRNRARHRLSKMLLRRGLSYTAGRQWTDRHRKWLGQLSFDLSTDTTVFQDYFFAVEQADERLSRLDAQLAELAEKDPWREPVGLLRCFHGIDTVTAMSVVSELHSFERFRSPRELMAYLGLVPRENSSAESRRLGGITKTGNARVRRLLVEAAWHYRERPQLGPALRRRRVGQPLVAIAIAERARDRLHRRFKRLLFTRAKPPQVAVTAVARELTGFLWAALQTLSSQARSAHEGTTATP